MSNVDDRIVNMEINNKQFLSGVKSSQTALSSLNRSINDAGNTRGMSSLGTAVDTVKHKFSLLNAAAVAAVGTITFKLVDAGLRMVKSLTLDPIMDGFREYQTNLNSIQTIMANTGEKVSVVNQYLNQLNHYSDKTIYNFSTMADAIGKFTSAGVNLPTATSAIKGMANVAALSGSNVQQLNSAMYQMSQALASGTIRLQDWNSLVNAGMGGKNLQNALKTTARAMNINVDGMIKKYGSFRDSLTKGGWLTTKVFNQTLSAFAGDLKKKDLLAKGFTEKQAKYMLDLAQRAQDAATKIKTFPQMLDVVKESIGSGWAKLFQDLMGNFNQSTALWTKVGTSITGVISHVFRSLDRSLLGWRKLGGYETLWKGFGNIFKALGNILHPFVEMFQSIMPTTQQAGSGLYALTSKFEKATAWIEKLTRGAASLNPVMSFLGQVFQIAYHVVEGVVRYFAALVPLVAPLSSAFASVVSSIAEVTGGFLKMGDAGGTIDAIFSKIIDTRAKVFGPLVDTVAALVRALNPLIHGNVSGFVNQFKAAFSNLGPFMASIVKDAGAAEQFLTSLGNQGQGVINKIASALGEAAAKVKSFAQGLIAGFGVFGGSDAKKAQGSSMQLVSATTKLNDSGNRLKDTLVAIGHGIKSTADAIGSGVSTIWKKLSSWVGGVDKLDLITVLDYIFSGYMIWKIKGFIQNFQKFVNNLTGITGEIKGVFSQLTDNLKSMQREVKSRIILNIAIAIGILAASLWVLSRIPIAQLGTALGAVAALFIMLQLSMKSLSSLLEGEDFKSARLIAVSAALAGLGFAMLEFATAVAILGHMKPEQIVHGMEAIALALAMLVTTAQALDKMKGEILKSAAAMVIMAFALDALSSAILIYSAIKWDTFVSGLVKMGLALGVVVLAMRAMPTESLLKNSIGMLAISGALVILATALEMLGHMSIWEIGKALVTLGISLGLLVGVLELIQNELPGAAALAVVAGSLILLAHALSIMGDMSWSAIIKGITELAIALGIFLLAGAAAEALAPGLMALGIAVALVGAGMLAAGIGVAAFAAGLAALVALGSAAWAVLTAAIQAFLAMLPTIAVQMAAALVAFIQAIADATPKIVDSFLKIMHSLFNAVNRLMPQIFHLFNHFLDLILTSIQKNAPKFGKTFEVLIDTALHVLQHTIPRFVNAGLNILQGILTGIENHLPKLMSTSTDIVVDFIRGIGNHIDKIINAGVDVIIAFIQGIAKNAVKLANSAGKTILQFLNGIDSAVKRYSGQIGASGRQIGYDLVNGLTGGLLDWGASKISSAVSHLASLIPGPIKKILGIASPSKVMKRIGRWVSIGFAHGILHSLDHVRRAGQIMARDTINAVTKTATDAQFAADAQQARADAYKTAAAILRHRENSKKITKAQKKDLEEQAKAYEKAAKEAQDKADKTQHAINARRKRREAAAKYRRADEQGKADILNQRAESSAKAAQRDREQAVKLAREADLIRKIDAKRAEELDKQAKRALADSEKAAKAARQNAAEASLWAAKAVVQSVADVQKKIDADRAATQEEAKLAAMSDQEKADYYTQQAKAEQAKSDAKYAAAEEALARAKRERHTNARQARRDIAAANRDVAAAEAAKQAADEAAQQASQYADNANQSSDSATETTNKLELTMPEVTIASSRVFGAQNMFDAYAKALSATQAAAAADKAPTIQFNQTNNSPEALSPTEVYRQSKNLLSSAERKLASIS